MLELMELGRMLVVVKALDILDHSTPGNTQVLEWLVAMMALDI